MFFIKNIKINIYFKIIKYNNIIQTLAEVNIIFKRLCIF